MGGGHHAPGSAWLPLFISPQALAGCTRSLNLVSQRPSRTELQGHSGQRCRLSLWLPEERLSGGGVASRRSRLRVFRSRPPRRRRDPATESGVVEAENGWVRGGPRWAAGASEQLALAAHTDVEGRAAARHGWN